MSSESSHCLLRHHQTPKELSENILHNHATQTTYVQVVPVASYLHLVDNDDNVDVGDLFFLAALA